MLNLETILTHYNPVTGEMPGVTMIRRHLSDLRGCFADNTAYDTALAVGNALLYSVGAVEPAGGDGDLHCGGGMLMPGKIGDEYFMTKGHLHSWRPAAEFYFGLTCDGVMLLEDEAKGEKPHLSVASKRRCLCARPHCASHDERRQSFADLHRCSSGQGGARLQHDCENEFPLVVVERNGQSAKIERK